MLKLNSAEISLPLLGSGALFIVAILFLYIFVLWRKKLYLGMFLLGCITFVFVTCEWLVILIGGYARDAALSRQFFRVEQIAGAFCLFALPYFISHLLEVSGFWRRLNFGVAYAGLAVACGITAVAFIAPDLFVSMTEPAVRSVPSEGAFGRGKEGVVYAFRDILLGAYILYSFTVTGLYLIRYFKRDTQSARDAVLVLIGLGMAIFGAVDDTVPIHFGVHIGFFPHAEYGRFIAGLIVFALLSTVALTRRFIVGARQVETAYMQLHTSEERFRQIAGNINEVFWLFECERPSGALKLLYVNPAYEKMWKRDSSSLYSSFYSWADAVYAEDREYVLHKMNHELGDHDVQIEYRINLPDESVLWIKDKISPIRGEDGNVFRYARISEDITNRKQAEERLVFLAYQDPLTGLMNRKSFFERFEEVVSLANRSNSDKLRALLFIDLDNFKDVNDSYGHSVGDLLLKEVTVRLQNAVRKTDLLFRLGDDEFTVILNSMRNDTDAAIVSQKILSSLSQVFYVQEYALHLSCSVGISIFPDDGDTPEILIKNADAALFEAKKTKNTYQFFTRALQDRATEKMKLTAKLRTGVDGREFLLYYQPQVDFAGRIRGAEALIRWRNPELGLVMPSKFIPLAEETGLIVPIGTWALDTACRDHCIWKERGFGDLSVSVNLSVNQFKDKKLIHTLERVLSDTGIKPESLHLEITESVIMENVTETAEKLECMKAYGISFAIDDFGTGYSSLKYLESLPISTIKVDRSFIIGIPDNRKQNALMRAIVTMAQSLDMDVVAEGVETQRQVEYLADLKFSGGIQGYFYSPPLPHDEFIAFVEKRNAEIAS